MRAKILTFLLLISLAPSAVMAGAKERKFNASADQVFAAALKAARENFSITYVDHESMTFAFHSGTSLTSNGFDCNASVEPDGDGARLVLNPQKKAQWFAWGAGGRIADKLFDATERNLTREKPGHD